MSEKVDAPTIDALELLKQHRDGDLLFELSQDLTNLVAAVRETKLGGEVTLKLRIAPTTKGDAAKVFLRDELKLTLPRAAKAPDLFYTTETNALSRDNPRQLKLFPEDKPARREGVPDAER